MKIVIENYYVRPKARPRLGRKGVYSPSASGERSLAWLILANAPDRTEVTGDVFCRLHIRYKKRCPADNDNLEKFVWDAIQKSGILRNDKQIRWNETRVFENARVDQLEIEILSILLSRKL